MIFRNSPGKKGAMMSKVYKKMRTAVICTLLCAFLSGCGDEKALVILPAGEEAAVQPAETRPSGGNGAQTEAWGQETFKTQDPAEIYVYVCGAVMTPGVVRLAVGSRAEQALQAAGGFAAEAQTDYVNLAARVTDGEKLYFPTKEEAVELERTAGAQSEGKVNINTADVQVLCTLSGIGPAKAGDIIAYREKNGDFQAPEDLMKVPGIKENAFEKLRDKITAE